MRNIQFTGKIRTAFIAVLFVVLSVAGFFFYYGQMRSRSKAAPTGTPELLLVAANNPPMQGDTIKVGVKLNPNGVTTDLYAFDVEVKFDSSKMTLANTADAAASVVLASDILKQQITVQGDIIHIVGTKIGTPFTPTNQQIADISFRMKQSSDFPVSFTWGASTLQVVNHVKLPLDLASNSSGGNSSGPGIGEDGNGAGISFDTVKERYQIGETVELDVLVNTGSEQFASAGVSFTYDTAKLTYLSTNVDRNMFDKSVSAPAPVGNTVSVNVARSRGLSGSVKIATVKFTAKALGTAQITGNKNASSIFTPDAKPKNILASVGSRSITIGEQGSTSSSSKSKGLQDPGESVPGNGDVLYVNSTTFDQAPLRYEQVIQLEKGEYILSASAFVYTLRGRGVLIAVACAESDCGDGKKLNDIFAKTDNFQEAATYIRREIPFTVTEGMNKKKLAVRVFVEDGSEADIDFISLTDVWGGEKLENYHFEKTQKVTDPRQYPQYWEADATGWMYGSIDPLKGKDGSLYINSSSRK